MVQFGGEGMAGARRLGGRWVGAWHQDALWLTFGRRVRVWRRARAGAFLGRLRGAGTETRKPRAEG